MLVNINFQTGSKLHTKDDIKLYEIAVYNLMLIKSFKLPIFVNCKYDI